MHTITFYPLGNADCCLMHLSNDKRMLIDYAAMKDPDDEDDVRVDLPRLLLKDLQAAKSNEYEVVAFTHLDQDHYKGASDFFYLEHAEKYKGDDRIKIKMLWVPAAAIIDTKIDDPEGRIIQAEARHRLKEGKGIRVFSRPEALKSWLEKHDCTLKSRRHLITDAGNLIPDVDTETDGVEFFVHSPFATKQEGETVDRNTASLVLHATFNCDGVKTKVFLGTDATHEVLSEIVTITKAKGNADRLCWDIMKLPHHCSYLSLGEDKGIDKTEPVKDVKSLYENYALENGIIISTSNPIPEKNSKEDKNDDPPHRQAANYYKQLRQVDFQVTMEHPSITKPRELVIKINEYKAAISKQTVSAVSNVLTSRSPRAGK